MEEKDGMQRRKKVKREFEKAKNYISEHRTVFIIGAGVIIVTTTGAIFLKRNPGAVENLICRLREMGVGENRQDWSGSVLCDTIDGIEPAEIVGIEGTTEANDPLWHSGDDTDRKSKEKKLRLTREVRQQILDDNEGFALTTYYEGKNFREQRDYRIEGGKLYCRSRGKTSGADSHFDTGLLPADDEQTHRFLREHKSTMNLEGVA